MSSSPRSNRFCRGFVIQPPSPKEDKRKCVFCGTGKVTLEHIWPVWIGKVLDEKYGIQKWQKIFPYKTFETKSLDSCVKRICRVCNNGWMSDLEDETKPILVPMMLADSPAIELTPAAQQTLATWALKTMLMAAFLSPDARTFPPPWIYSRFYRERRPPDYNAVIWTAAYQGHLPQLTATVGTVDARKNYRYTADGIVVPEKTTSKAALGTLRILFTVFQVFVYGGYGVPMGHRSDGKVLHRIWPKQDISLVWPANRVALDDAGIEYLQSRAREIEPL